MLSVLIFLVPLFFTNLTPEFYATNKFALLILVLPVLLLIWTINMVKEGRIKITLNRLNLPVFLLAVSFIASTVITSPNKVESLTSSGGAGVIIALVLLYFLISNLVTKKEQVIYPLIASGIVLSLLFAFQYLGITEKLLPFDFLKNRTWTPTGTVLGLATILLSLIPLTVEEALLKRKFWAWVATLIIGLGLMLSVVALFKDDKPVILPYGSAWAIAVDSLKSVRIAAFGVGPGNYVDAFTARKPLDFNNSAYWGMRFGSSSSFLLQLITEVGLIGFVLYFLIIGNVARTGKKYLGNGVFVSLLILFASQVILPSPFVVLFVIFSLLGLFARKSETAVLTEQGIILPRIFIGGALLFLIIVFWFGSRWYLADYYFMKSLVAASNNKGVDTYNFQIKAVMTNPYTDNYRISYSQTNLALASAIAQKGSISDQDRQDISSLIQQAIREAKAATSLNPLRADNWENLAYIYRNLINAAQGSDQWAIASYNEAIKLDPLNPNLRINLGGVLYGLKNYDGAIQQFTIAINLKPNWPNAHYNLSAAYNEKKDYQNAFTEMQNTLALLDPKSNDFGKASAELEELRKKLPSPPVNDKGKAPETLTEPSKKTVEVSPKIELPKDQAPVIPTQQPTPNL